MSQEINEIEVTIDQLKESIEISNRLQRLEKDPLFEEFVIKGYLENKAIQLTGVLAHPAMQSKEKQKEVQEELKAIGFLRHYFMQIHMRADNAERALDSHYEELRLAREEEAAEALDDTVEA